CSELSCRADFAHSHGVRCCPLECQPLQGNGWADGGEQFPGLLAFCFMNLIRQHWLAATPLPRTPSCTLPNGRPHDRHPSRRDADKAAARAECQLAIRFDDYLLPGLQVYFAAGFGQLCGAGLDVLASGNGQMVIGAGFSSAVSVGAVLLFGQVLVVAVGLDAFVPCVAAADALVVPDVLFPVALGVDQDLFFTGPVFDAQFVEAVTAGAAQALEQAAGLVLGQLIGHRVGAVVQAAADQGLVRIAFEEADQYFHADARDGDAAPVVAGPVAGDS